MRIENRNDFRFYSYLKIKQTAESPEQAEKTEVSQDTFTVAAGDRQKWISKILYQQSEDDGVSLTELRKQLKSGDMEIAKLKEQLASSNEQASSVSDAAQTQIKCFKIARWIMKGDKVKAADLRYLAKNAPELYAKAIMLRMQRSNPQKHKQISKNEENVGSRTSAAEDCKNEGELTSEVGGESSSGESAASLNVTA